MQLGISRLDPHLPRFHRNIKHRGVRNFRRKFLTQRRVHPSRWVTMPEVNLPLRNRLRNFSDTFQPGNDFAIVMIAIIIKIVLRGIGRRHLSPEYPSNLIQRRITIDTPCRILSCYPLVCRGVSSRYTDIRPTRCKNFRAHKRILQGRRTLITKLPMHISSTRTLILSPLKLVVAYFMRQGLCQLFAVPHGVSVDYDPIIDLIIVCSTASPPPLHTEAVRTHQSHS